MKTTEAGGGTGTFNNVMTNGGTTRMEWQPERLFTLDCKRKLSVTGMIGKGRPTKLVCVDNNKFSEREVQDIALGSFLHLLQDSFSSSHVMRQNGADIGASKLSGVGKIVQFGNFNFKHEKSHAKADIHIVEGEAGEGFDLTKLSSQIIELSVHQRTDEKSRWPEAKEIVERVFEIVNPDKEPGSIPADPRMRSVKPCHGGMRLQNGGHNDANNQVSAYSVYFDEPFGMWI